MNSRRVLTLGALALSLGPAAVLQSGCLALAVHGAMMGTRMANDSKGTVAATWDRSYESVAGAADKVLHEMKFANLSKSAAQQSFVSTFSGRTAQGDALSVVVTKEAENLTKIEIRIGQAGDRETSRAILEEIRARVPGS